MVRRVWQNRLVRGAARYLRLFFRWLLIWLLHLASQTRLGLQGGRHLLQMLMNPRNPNNLYIRYDEGAADVAEAAPNGVPPLRGESVERPALLWADWASQSPSPEGLSASALSLWKGERQVAPDEGAAAAVATNRRYAYLDLLAAQIKGLRSGDIQQLDELIQRLARKWLDEDQVFETYQRRNRLDIRSTLRYNIPRFAGRVLTFRWAPRERPLPQRVKPARILVIGDVSHSMVHYVSILLYFFHQLNLFFTVDSYIFSERSTHATPHLNGSGTFEERVARLMEAAASWSAGTRFGSSLEEIARLALVDENTWVIIATDGKVSLQGNETDYIERYMGALRERARSVIFVTPSADFSDGARGRTKPVRLGSLKYGVAEVPIYEMGPPLWYGTLAKYADRLYLVRTVQDLIDMTENLIMASR